jgi:hypothetical protein
VADWATKGAGPSIWSLLRGLVGLGSISKEKLKNHQISDPLNKRGHNQNQAHMAWGRHGASKRVVKPPPMKRPYGSFRVAAGRACSGRAWRALADTLGSPWLPHKTRPG